MVPIEQKKMYDLLDDEGLEFGALYHSHTRTAAYPSPTDVREAREIVPYVIVSLAEDDAVIKAFLILKDPWDAEDGEIEEVPVIVER
jgi:proteasome lid subunit RPN8/RPN11